VLDQQRVRCIVEVERGILSRALPGCYLRHQYRRGLCIKHSPFPPKRAAALVLTCTYITCLIPRSLSGQYQDMQTPLVLALCDLRHSEAGHTMTSVQSNVNRLVGTKDGARSTVMIQECLSDPADIRPCIRDAGASVYVVMQSLNLLSLSRFTLGLDHPIHALLIKHRLFGYPLLSKLDHRPNQILPLHSSLH